jgi:peptide/nickel transport system substrate-binding protein
VPFSTVYQKGLAGLPTTIWGALSPMDELYWETPPK